MLNLPHPDMLCFRGTVISKAKTEALHRLQTHYLPLYFPEIDRFRHNSRSEWFFIFLDRFPVPAAILEFSADQFIQTAWPLIGRKVAKTRILGDIYETARQSIGRRWRPTLLQWRCTGYR